MTTDQQIAQVSEEGQRSWGFAVPGPVLAAHLDRLGVDPATVAEHGPDLYLAAGCAAGLAPALTAFESAFLNRVPQFVFRVCRDQDRVQEIQQDLRVRMLVGPPPRIASYAGAGPLASFLCVAAVRLALDRVGRDGAAHQAMDNDALTTAAARTLDPESQALSGEHRQTVQEAIDRALVLLPARDRAVLRFYFIEGLNIEAIGAIYGVNRSTVARWLAEIRGRLLEAVRERVGDVVGASPSELHSLLQVVRGGLHASVSRLWRQG
jgi:RNA polymerase sigma-70 factor (ECF subfamily)